jgi:hypothetical protein
MVIGPLRIARDDPNGWRAAAAGLVLAAALVGAAITIGGSAARIINPVAALLWVASGVWLALSLPPARRPLAGWAAAVASGLALGAVVRPGDLVEAAAGFAIAGGVIVLAAGDRRGGWALLAPAIYLPVHLAIGIGRAIMGNGGVRTDPPPTAAIVPLVMVAAALGAGIAVSMLVNRSR